MTHQNLILVYDNFGDQATLSGGSFFEALPLSNLQKQDISLVARSTDLALSSTRLTINLNGAREVRGIVIGPGNLSTAYLHRIIWDSGQTEWSQGAQREPWNTLPFEHHDYWTGLLPWSDLERGMWLIHLFKTPIFTSSLTIEIDDRDNPDGYIEFGRLIIGRTWQPSLNYDYSGNGLGFLDHSLRVQTLAGNKISRRRINPRTFQFSLNHLRESELYRDGYDFQRIAGFDGEVFVIPDPDDLTFRDRRSFLATIQRMDPLTQSMFQRGGTGFQLEEII